MLDNLTLSFAGHEITWNELPENSKVALATLGFSTKLKNSIAGLNKAVKGEGGAAWSDEDRAEAAADFGLVTVLESGDLDAFAKAVCDAKQAEMFEAIRSGIDPSSRRGGTRLSDDEKLRLSIEIEVLEKAFKAKGATLPKRSKPEEKDAFAAVLEKARGKENFVAAVEKEFAKRKNAKAIDLDLDI